MLTLGQAARLTGLGKTTITRAIKSGRLSATRRDDGSYEIDPSELSRVYEVRPDLPATPETVTEIGLVVQDETPVATPRDPEVTARLAALEAEVDGLKALLAEVRQSRDDWKGQANRLVLAPPATPSVTPATVSSRSWWPFRRMG